MRYLAAVLLALAACAPESVRTVTLSPTTLEIAAVLREADARWEAAGVDPDRVVVADVGSPEGAPVRFVPERAPTSQTIQVGRGFAFVGVRWVELCSLDTETAMHELGHVLGIGAPGEEVAHLDDTDPTCASDGPGTRPLMCSHVGDAITAEDLNLACEAGACVGFNPER